MLHFLQGERHDGQYIRSTIIHKRMNAAGPKTSYPAVAFTVVTLSVIVLLTQYLKGLIPPSEPNRLGAEQGPFVRAASRQSIEWLTLADEPFDVARRTGKPIFLLIGAPWSRSARIADETAFKNPDIAATLRRFICVRVDVTRNPEWMTAFLPVERASVAFDVSFQAFVLNSKGRLVTGILRARPDDVMNDVTLGRELRQAAEHLAAGEEKELPQARQIALLTEARPVDTLDFARQLTTLRDLADPVNGGFPQREFQRLLPHSWRYLALAGEVDELDRSLQAVLRTSIFDWLDGGFFWMAEGRSWGRIEFDKLAAQNAEMMTLLAEAYRLTGRQLYRTVSERTFDTLTQDFSRAGDLFAYRTADEDGFARSVRSSFTPRELRDLFAWSQLAVLRSQFGLDPTRNQQMVIRAARPEALLTDPRLRQLLDRLRRASRRNPVSFGGADLLDTSGILVARLLETARLLDDQRRLQEAASLFQNLTRFRTGLDDVVHALDRDGGAHRYLGDYLAYADACLEMYISLGFRDVLEDGFRVLQRSVELFAGARQGVFYNSLLTGGEQATPNFRTPCITDDIIESTSAMAIRLLDGYGSLFAGDKHHERRRDAQKMTERAWAIRAQLTPALSLGGPLVSAAFIAAWHLEYGGTALVIGPNGTSKARDLERLAPLMKVIPVSSDIRPDLQARGAGIYLTQRGSDPIGPIAFDEAIGRLRKSKESRGP